MPLWLSIDSGAVGLHWDLSEHMGVGGWVGRGLAEYFAQREGSVYAANTIYSASLIFPTHNYGL